MHYLPSRPILHYALYPAHPVLWPRKEADNLNRWVYLFFFNTLWVWIPLWILYQGYIAFTSALNPTTSKQKKR